MTYVSGIAAEQLKSIIDRIERLEQDKANIATDIQDLYAEARANGYDTKTLRQVVKIRRMDQNDRREQEELLDLYLHALGMAVEGASEVELEREKASV